MSAPAEFAAFRDLIADTFIVDPAAITRATTAADVDGWDSVSHAMLIMTIEEKYGVRFPDREVFSFQDVGALFTRTMQLAGRS
jgi:acyl carrier protein